MIPFSLGLLSTRSIVPENVGCGPDPFRLTYILFKSSVARVRQSPTRTLADSGGLWRTLADSGGLRRTLADSGGLWRISVRSGACRNVKTGYAMIGQVYKDMLGHARIC